MVMSNFWLSLLASSFRLNSLILQWPRNRNQNYPPRLPTQWSCPLFLSWWVASVFSQRTRSSWPIYCVSEISTKAIFSLTSHHTTPSLPAATYPCCRPEELKRSSNGVDSPWHASALQSSPWRGRSAVETSRLSVASPLQDQSHKTRARR